jgi:hypothetical protein
MVNCVDCVKPESNPPEVLPFAARYVQGFWKDDWVTECSIDELEFFRRIPIDQEEILTQGSRK